MNEEIIQNTSAESESIVEDNSVNEMEKSFTQEASCVNDFSISFTELSSTILSLSALVFWIISSFII